MSKLTREDFVKLAKKHGLDLEILPEDDPIYKSGSMIFFLNRSPGSTRSGESGSTGHYTPSPVAPEVLAELSRRASAGMREQVESPSPQKDESPSSTGDGSKDTCSPAEPIILFEVSENGTLYREGIKAAETRAECYDWVVDTWSESASALADALEECPPLAWEVEAIYDEARTVILEAIESAGKDDKHPSPEREQLAERLADMPEDPEGGVKHWLRHLDSDNFKIIAERIRSWFASPPEWQTEATSIPDCITSEGAAYEHFSLSDAETLDTLEIDLVEGFYPGDDSRVAKLRCSVEEANAAAQSAGLSERFVSRAGTR